MRPRRNHLYIQDKKDPTIYREAHIQNGLRDTGRVFDLLKTFNEPDDWLRYHKKQNEMLLIDLFSETAILLKYRGEDENS